MSKKMVITLESPGQHIAMSKLMLKWREDKTKRPKTMKELEEELRDFGISFTEPDGKFDRDLEVCYLEVPKDNPHILLPPAEDNKADPPAGSEYPIPSFYGDAFVDPTRKTMNDVEKSNFKKARIGEYACLKCG